MNELIEPKVLKGFRDLLPQKEIVRKEVIARLEKVFTSFGFVPIDTPVLEYAEILLGKGGGETDKQVYRFFDHGNRDVALRFDLTVPFARFIATHEHELYFPFKRYHIAKVYRGENTQRGRYREFTQCDFDIVGSDTASSDLEILLVMESSFKALGIEGLTFRFSHRGVFSYFLSRLELSGKTLEILRLVDKLPKIGRDEVKTQLTDLVDSGRAEKILDFISKEENNRLTLEKLRSLSGGTNPALDRLTEICKLLEEGPFKAEFVLDPSITRGLDYYTGIVYETFLNDLPGIGSVCSGGRYDNLASLYTKTQMPGVGSSIGLDRLLAAMEELGMVEEKPSNTDLLILCLEEELTGHYHSLASGFRERGFSAEVFPEKRKIAGQFSFAEKKGIPFCVICGSPEKAAGKLNLRQLSTRDTFDSLSLEEAAEKMRNLNPAKK